ncbi:hypothetical protein JTE88_02960 [Arcanobacterium phocisimile]|uniref:DUF4439 domain-containing protein n=1 Tax=Arcanobacterium phocisimile TaxID=1302235 RepID=A0ABX7IJV4_9ACTO|nr:hypothetical protein [Arcanobacterium phocisimile]QRV02714.1 hypothetical protein JTE88_02960 [Arcanobacterium phocisimile]
MTDTPHIRSRFASWLLFVSIAITACAIFVLTLVVMGTRLENQSVAPKPPSASEIERQDIAVSIAQTRATAQELQAANQDPALQPLLGELVSASETWLDHVGGVWIPWPQGAPEGYENPELDLSAPEVSISALQSQLAAISDKLSAATDVDPELSLSIATSARTFAAHFAPAAERAQVCSSPDISVLASAVNSAPAIVTFDTARQWLEHDAALREPENRGDEEYKITLLTELTNSALDSGGKDARHPIAPLPQTEDTDSAVSSLVEHELLSHAAQLDQPQRTATVALLCTLNTQASVAGLPGAE